MATVEKSGNSYRIVVSGGYTAKGKQVRERMTWTPPEGMSEDKARKEAQRQAVLFEERVKRGRVVDSKIKLETFIEEKYIPDYVELYLKRSTRAGYKRIIRGIIDALGHMKLCDIRPAHINAFYRNLQEDGMRQRTVATAKKTFSEARAGLSKNRLANLAGVTYGVVMAAERGDRIALSSADKLAAALEVKTSALFDLSHDPTPLSDRTVLSYHRVLSGIMTKAVQWEYISYNPCSHSEHPTDPKTEAPYFDVDFAHKLSSLWAKKEPSLFRLGSWKVVHFLCRGFDSPQSRLSAEM